MFEGGHLSLYILVKKHVFSLGNLDRIKVAIQAAPVFRLSHGVSFSSNYFKDLRENMMKTVHFHSAILTEFRLQFRDLSSFRPPQNYDTVYI